MTNADCTNPACAFFERAVNKRRRSNRIAAAVVLVLSLVGLFWGASETDDYSMARMATLGGFGVVVAVIVAGATFVRSRGLEALRTPERIVWFYGIRQGPYITGVMIGTEAGKLYRLPVPNLKEANQGLALVRQAATAATEGFTEPRRVQFRQQPRALRKAASASS